MEGTIQVTQSRISACDNYKVQVADPAKTVRLQKEQQLRKVIRCSLYRVVIHLSNAAIKTSTATKPQLPHLNELSVYASTT